MTDHDAWWRWAGAFLLFAALLSCYLWACGPLPLRFE